jgi:hypothetical protein
LSPSVTAAQRDHLVELYWRWRREGYRLPAEEGVIVLASS